MIKRFENFEFNEDWEEEPINENDFKIGTKLYYTSPLYNKTTHFGIIINIRKIDYEKKDVFIMNWYNINTGEYITNYNLHKQTSYTKKQLEELIDNGNFYFIKK